MAKPRNTVLLIASHYRTVGNRQLGPSFLSGLLSRVRREARVNPIVLSHDDDGEYQPRDHPQGAESRIISLWSSSIFRATLRTGSDSEFWPGQARGALGADIVRRGLTSAQIAREVVKLLPTLRAVHWLEPLAPWNMALTYFLKSRGVKSYMTIFSLHKRYPAHYGLLRMTLAGLDKVVATTGGLQQVLSKDVRVPGQDIVRIPLGVDLELYKPCKEKAAARQRLSISPDCKVFSWFGPIEPCTPSDFACVLNAAQYVHERFPASFFIFAFKGKIPSNARACGNWVRFYQDLDHIRDILDATDAVILPFSRKSWQRGLPLTIVEALACGIPVVTTRRGGLDETIADGFNGLVIQEAEDVSGAVLRLCEEEGMLDHMSQSARLTAEQRFDLSRVAQAYVSLWDG